MSESRKFETREEFRDFLSERFGIPLSQRVRPVTALNAIGSPRPVPLDVAMSWIGSPLLVPFRSSFARNPDLRPDFWALRANLDCGIISFSSRCLASPLSPTFFPSGFGFEDLPRRVACGVWMMHVRRRLAGIDPFLCGGLPYGHWDDCFSPSTIVPMSWDMVRDLIFLMVARDVARVRAGLDPEPAEWPSVHREAMAIMEGHGWTVAAAVASTRALKAARDPFFGPGDPSGTAREVRRISGPFKDDSWIARYGTLSA